MQPVGVFAYVIFVKVQDKKSHKSLFDRPNSDYPMDLHLIIHELQNAQTYVQTKTRALICDKKKSYSFFMASKEHK